MRNVIKIQISSFSFQMESSHNTESTSHVAAKGQKRVRATSLADARNLPKPASPIQSQCSPCTKVKGQLCMTT